MKFTAAITLALLAVASAAPLLERGHTLIERDTLIEKRHPGRHRHHPLIEKRRFGQEHTPRADADFQAMKDLSVGTGFEAQLGDLSGAAVRALLAKAGACDQQDVADQCVDFAHQIGQKFANSFGPQREKDLIKVCKDYRTLERNTPQAGQPSALCNKAPRNKELNGLVQAQDPTGKGGNGGTGNGGTGNGGTGNGGTGNGGTGNGGTGNGGTGNGGKCGNGGTGSGGTGNGGTGSGGTGNGGTGNGGNGKVNNVAFTNPVGGVQMPLIKKLPAGSGANFEVNGSQFQNIGAAHNRQCDVQHNLCFNKFNGGDHSFQGSDCDNQNNVCKAGDPVFSN